MASLRGSVWLFVVVGLVLVGRAGAQGNESIEMRDSARSLHGTVLDTTGSVISDAEVSLCRETFKNCQAVTKTGKHGEFATRKSVKEGERYYLRIDALGFDQVRLDLTIRSRAPALKVVLKPGA